MGGETAGLVVALLGPIEIGPAGGVLAPVPRPRLRVLLGLLGVADGRMITTESLVAGMWGEEWSPEREKNLHALVYQLRRRLAGLEPGRAAIRALAGAADAHPAFLARGLAALLRLLCRWLRDLAALRAQ